MEQQPPLPTDCCVDRNAVQRSKTQKTTISVMEKIGKMSIKTSVDKYILGMIDQFFWAIISFLVAFITIGKTTGSMYSFGK